MFQENHEAMAPATSHDKYQPHTVEILYCTAVLLVLAVTIYLTFFDSWTAF